MYRNKKCTLFSECKHLPTIIDYQYTRNKLTRHLITKNIPAAVIVTTMNKRKQQRIRH